MYILGTNIFKLAALHTSLNSVDETLQMLLQNKPYYCLYFVKYSQTPRSRVLLEEIHSSSQDIPSFYGARMPIITLTKAHQWTLS